MVSLDKCGPFVSGDWTIRGWPRLIVSANPSRADEPMVTEDSQSQLDVSLYTFICFEMHDPCPLAGAGSSSFEISHMQNPYRLDLYHCLWTLYTETLKRNSFLYYLRVSRC